MTGSEQARENYEDGPPELITTHPFHTIPIEDIQWLPKSSANLCSQEALATVETDTRMQIWSISSEFTENEIDILHLMEAVEDDELE